MADIEEELELKSGENNRLRTQVADLEKAVQDLYGSRKGEGSIHVELNNMRADNEKLIKLLKETGDYQDLSSTDIMKKAKYLSNQSIGAICDTFGIQPNKAAARRAAKKDGDANEWIPTEAVKKIKEIQQTFDSKMTETCISNILYEFNIIWRNIMRKEIEAIKKKYSLQIQDLRRQLVTKKAFDEDESQREISRLKKELHFIQMRLNEAKRAKGIMNTISKENLNTDNISKSTKPTAERQIMEEDLDGREEMEHEMNLHNGMGESYLSSEVM